MAYLYDESKDNGWVKLRRNLLPHLADGRLMPGEFTALIYLILTASSSTGETLTCASVIADAYRWKLRAAQRVLDGLCKKGYIQADKQLGRHGLYKVRVFKYERTTGTQEGTFTEPSVTLMRSNLVAESGTEVTLRVAPKPSLCVTLKEASEVIDNRDSYDDSFSVTDADDDAERDADGGSEVTLSVSNLVAETAPIQEQHFNTEKEKVGRNEGGPASPSSRPVQEKEVPPAVLLVRTFFAHQGRPEKFKSSLASWRDKFKQLLSKDSLETIKETMDWSFNESEFWPKFLIRHNDDPLSYFLSKYDKLKSDAAGQLKAKQNQVKQERSSSSPADRQPQPKKIRVCQVDALAEFMKAEEARQQ
jgi:hypothetical protein